ncbi:uncharacterized protein LOC123699643 [Colias croceus]|uniref:uncharacterized protein LOC123699643 n=1 Tax=Colias crocea TaxID=72248 RepID=UPI001E27CF7D|nr:uncharacterized protein LOC123699643 [Colias croceus]XP_045502595.1 uncharacterized protein LOC123699643 [Colias croceus]
MEAKLKQYRALRRRQQFVDNIKQKLENSKEKFINFLVPSMAKVEERHEEEVVLLEDDDEDDSPITYTKALLEESVDLTSEVSEVESIEENQESWRYCMIKWTIYAIIWLTLFIYFLKLQFGAVFFVISVLIGICLNTSTKPKKRGEVSAYSVFNENCVSIDGTLKAEQFEKEIRYGAGSVRTF